MAIRGANRDADLELEPCFVSARNDTISMLCRVGMDDLGLGLARPIGMARLTHGPCRTGPPAGH